MKKIIILALLALGISAGAQELKLDEILEKYYKASGFDKLQEVKTVVMTGTLIQQDEMPLTIIKKRPAKFKMIFDVQDITAYQVFDGKTAWMTAPWTGNPKPQAMPADRAKDMKIRADFDGPIFNWQGKGHTAELAGMDTLAGMPLYKVKLTRNDGGIEYYYFDNQDFMLQKRMTFRKIREQEVEVVSYFSDYRNIGGVMFPFTTQTMMGGQPSNTFQYSTITLNDPVEDVIFEMPAPKTK
jgi:outer membrane lipoprotein-sorting protein